MELATYIITFKWISGACNEASDCLSYLAELPQDKPVLVNMLSATNTDGPAFNTRSQTHKHISRDTYTLQLDFTPEVSEGTTTALKSLTTDRLQALLQMQKTDPLLQANIQMLVKQKSISAQTDLFTHVKGLLYTHVSDSIVPCYKLPIAQSTFSSPTH